MVTHDRSPSKTYTLLPDAKNFLVVYKTVSNNFNATAGVPQEGVLSPLLYTYLIFRQQPKEKLRDFSSRSFFI